jgi:DNA-binding NarL/FixJ family response regulator
MLNLAQTKLTQRDREILDLLIEGLGNREIGERLGIGERTVKAHVRVICLRAGMKPCANRILLASAYIAYKNAPAVTLAS